MGFTQSDCRFVFASHTVRGIDYYLFKVEHIIVLSVPGDKSRVKITDIEKDRTVKILFWPVHASTCIKNQDSTKISILLSERNTAKKDG